MHFDELQSEFKESVFLSRVLNLSVRFTSICGHRIGVFGEKMQVHDVNVFACLSVCVCVSVWGHQFVHIWGWKSNSLFPSWQHRWLFSQLCMPRWFTFDLFLKWIPASHWAQTVIRSRLPACAWGDKPRPCVQPSTIVLRDPLRSRKVVWVCPRFVLALNEQTVYNQL